MVHIFSFIWDLRLFPEMLQRRQFSDKRKSFNDYAYSSIHLLKLPSKFLEQVVHPHIKSFGNSHQGIDANRLFPTLNLTEINRMQISLFRQFFLAHPVSLPVFSDGISD
jgi:hypothetical protein